MQKQQKVGGGKNSLNIVKKISNKANIFAEDIGEKLEVVNGLVSAMIA